MSISSALNAAKSGLQTTSLQANTIASNIANASTPGYLRRSVNLQETLLAGVTNGVRSTGITRTENDALTSQRREVTSDLAQAGLLKGAWTSISTRLGNSVEGSGLFNTISTFETAVSDVALTPESNAALSRLFETTQAVVTDLNDLAEIARSTRGEADAEIATSVRTINDSVARVSDLNGLIARSDRTGEKAAALMDERDRALDQISEFMPIQVIDRENGTVDIVTKEGVFLLAGTPRELSFAPSADFSAGQTLQNGDLSGLYVGDIEITPGTSMYSAVSSGILSGLFTLRDSDIPDFTGQLDSVATDLIDRLSGSALNPSAAPNTEGIFIDTSLTGGPGVASRIAINSAIDPASGGSVLRLRDGLDATVAGPAGNADHLNRMKAALTKQTTASLGTVSGRYSASELAAEFSSITAQRQYSADLTHTSLTSQFAIIAEAEQTATGVDMDTELQNLITVEQAYAANARVIEIASQMLERLMQL